MINIEFKVRVKDFARVRAVLRQRQAQPAGVLEQIDTYFAAPQGRLKLREIRRRAAAGMPAAHSVQLIFYQRANAAAVKRSDYHIAALPHGDALREVLGQALGERQVIKKSRELYLLPYGGTIAKENETHIRIHLDEVEELGSFIEVEALADDHITPVRAEQEARTLLAQFGIAHADLVAGSYADLLAEKV